MDLPINKKQLEHIDHSIVDLAIQDEMTREANMDVEYMRIASLPQIWIKLSLKVILSVNLTYHYGIDWAK